MNEFLSQKTVENSEISPTYFELYIKINDLTYDGKTVLIL